MRPVPAVTHDLAALYLQRSAIERNLKAANTLRSYADDWTSFSRFCAQTEQVSLPATPETVALYVTDLLGQGRKVSTAVRRTSGITDRHRANGYPTPVTDVVWALIAGARRMRREQPRQMQPLNVAQLRSISGLLRTDDTAESLRDRAVLVLGFTSALRRANITQLLLSDVTFAEQGVMIKVHHEKCDQEGRGRAIGVMGGQHSDTDLSTCLRGWLAHRGVDEGPLFTTVREKAFRHLAPSTVGRIVKAGVRRIGLDPTRYAGHSLRSGFICEASLAGVSALVIAAHVGHRRIESLRRYFRPTDLFRGNASGQIGL